MQEKNAPREVFFVERYAMDRLSAALLRVRGLKRVKKRLHVSGMDRQWTDNASTLDRQSPEKDRG